MPSGTLEPFYATETAEVTFESFEAVDEDTVTVSGTFSGTLLYKESMAEGDPSQTLELNGSFDIDRLTRLDIE